MALTTEKEVYGFVQILFEKKSISVAELRDRLAQTLCSKWLSIGAVQTYDKVKSGSFKYDICGNISRSLVYLGLTTSDAEATYGQLCVKVPFGQYEYSHGEVFDIRWKGDWSKATDDSFLNLEGTQYAP